MQYDILILLSSLFRSFFMTLVFDYVWDQENDVLFFVYRFWLVVCVIRVVVVN